MMQQHLADKNIALDLVRVTEAAALASAKFTGLGDKELVDRAAVDAMRIAFQSLHIKGTIVIGEGEKDDAPMLYTGEKVGFGDGLEFDIAVDPIDGTSCVAGGRPNGIAAVGIALKGTMFNPGHSYYCEKMAVGPEAANVIDLDAPIKDNLLNVAKALGKRVGDLKVFVLDKPRHAELINQIHAAGARVMVHSDGDIAGALMTIDPRSDIDMLVGVDLKAIRSIDELVTTDQCFFSATGVTPGELLDGVHYKGGFALTSSMCSRGRTGTVRYIEAWHDRKKLSKMSTIEY